MTIDELQLKISSDSTTATQGLDALAASLERISAATTGTESLAKLSTDIRGISESLKTFQISPEIADAASGITALSDSFSKFDSEPASQAIADVTQQLSDIPARASVAGDKMSSSFARGFSAISSGMSIVGQSISSIIDRSSRTVSSVVSFFKNGFSAIASSAQSVFQNIQSVFDRISQAAASITSAFKSVKSAIQAAIHPVHTLRKAFGLVDVSSRNFSKNLASAFKRILLYRGIRAIISAITKGFSEGLQNIVKYDEQVKRSMDSITTDAMYLKNSLAAMAAPVIQTLAPAFRMLTNLIVQVMNAIGMLFAALGGSTVFTRATRSAQKFGNAVKGAAKALKQFTLGFDELNVIADTAAGGGGVGADISGMFDTANIPDYIYNLIDAIKGPMDELYNYFYDWGFGLGQRLTAALEGIPWASIKDWGIRLATALAASLNGIVDGINWRVIGTTIGNGIQTILDTAYTFMTTFRWDKLGIALATGFMGLIDSVNPDTLGRLFASKWNAVFDVLSNAIENVNWGEVGNFISNTVNSWFSEINWSKLGSTISKFVNALFFLFRYTFENIKWDDVGQNIKTSLESMTDDIKWENISSTISDGVNGILQAIIPVLTEYDWDSLGGKIGTSLSDAIRGINATWLGSVLASVINNIFGFIGGAIDGFDWIGTGAFIASTLTKMLDDLNWQQMGETVSDGIIGALSMLRTALERIPWAQIGEDVATFLKNIDWTTVWNEVEGVISAAAGGIVNMLAGLFGDSTEEGIKKVVAAIAGVATAMLAVHVASLLLLGPIGLVQLGIEALIAIIAVLILKWDDIKSAAYAAWTFIKNTWNAAKDWFNETVIVPIVSYFDSLWYTIKKGAQAAWNNIVWAFHAAVDWFNNTIINPITSAFDNLWRGIKTGINNIIGFFNSMISRVESGINGMISSLNKVQFTMPDWMGGGSFGINIAPVSMGRISTLESGGFPDVGQMFIAREAGPELVGNIGSRTAVVNNEQIIRGISDGVADANREQNALISQQNELLRAILEKTGVYLDGRELAGSVEKAQRERGTTIMPGGAIFGV